MRDQLGDGAAPKLDISVTTLVHAVVDGRFRIHGVKAANHFINRDEILRFLDVFSGTGTISFTEKTQPEYLFRTLLPQCVSIMARLP